MARFNAPAERYTARIVEEERSSDKKSRKVVMGIAAVGLSAAAVFGIAPAHADEVVGFGGMGDPSGEAYGDMLRATGQLGPNDTYHAVPYPASIWPAGPETLAQSIDEAMVNANPVIDQAKRNLRPGEKLVIRGYSEGGIAAARKANELYGPSVVPGTVIIDNSPVSDVGMFNPQDPLVRTFLPMATNAIGVPTGDRAPAGTILRSSEQDLWTMGGPSDLGQLIGQAGDTFMGPAHAVQDERAPYYVWVGEDGIVHHTFPGLGTGGAPLGPVGMGGNYAPAPVPSPAPEAAPAPVEQFPHQYDEFYHAPNFTSQVHVDPAPAPAPSYSSSAAETDNSRVVVTKSQSGGTNKQTVSYSKKFSPTKH